MKVMIVLIFGAIVVWLVFSARRSGNRRDPGSDNPMVNPDGGSTGLEDYNPQHGAHHSASHDCAVSDGGDCGGGDGGGGGGD